MSKCSHGQKPTFLSAQSEENTPTQPGCVMAELTVAAY